MCSLRDSTLGFPYANVTFSGVFFRSLFPLSPPSGWRRASRTKRTTRGKSELTAVGRCWFYAWLCFFFLKYKKIIVWHDPQGEAGAPGQQGTEGARGDRGIQVGVSTPLVLFKIAVVAMAIPRRGLGRRDKGITSTKKNQIIYWGLLQCH